jgi:hypothetical protein
VFNSAASRFKSSCVETSIRTLVLCMQISIQPATFDGQRHGDTAVAISISAPFGSIT